MSLAIGIDVGTTNCKVALCDLPSCDVVHLEKFPSPKIVEGGRVDFDIEGLKRGLVQALAACARHAEAGRIEFISIASVGESGVLLDGSGGHGATSIAWFDTRGHEYADRMHEDGTARSLYRVTGIPAHSNYGLFKLLWLRDHGQDLEGMTWLPLGDFVAWWLCGEVAQDESLASRTFAMDVATGEVAAGVLEPLGISPSMFPRLVGSGVARGEIRREVADATGIAGGCAVCVAGHDHMVGSVACGLDPSREMLNSTGTSEGILTLNEAPVLSDESFQSRLSNGRYVERGLFSYYASLPTAGFALEWVAEQMGIDEDTFFDVMPHEIHRKYLSGAFEGRELIFVPHLRGSGPPHRTVHAKGFLYGFADGTTRDDLFFSATLGLALELRNLYGHMLGMGGREVAKVIGPSIKSPLWMQLKADALGVEVRACRVRESVARGAVMLAGRAQGWDIVPSFESTVYASDPGRHAYLEHLFQTMYLPLEQMVASFEG
ncbi:MAG: FGGY family carbohydrate kinase [Collinsella sp.]|nr:FGGY family carbohydrate kinase [Collinsella sp.]